MTTIANFLHFKFSKVFLYILSKYLMVHSYTWVYITHWIWYLMLIHEFGYNMLNLSTCNIGPSLSPTNIDLSTYGMSHTYTYSRWLGQVTKFPNNHHPERFQLSIFIPITEKYPKDLIGRRAKLLLYMSRGEGMGERPLPGIFFQKNSIFWKHALKNWKIVNFCSGLWP